MSQLQILPICFSVRYSIFLIICKILCLHNKNLIVLAKLHKKNDIRKFVCHFYAFLYFSCRFFITAFYVVDASEVTMRLLLGTQLACKGTTFFWNMQI